MPGFDRTGPRGQGSQTGRRMGKCNPENTNPTEEIQRGRGLGRGLGRRLRLGNGWNSPGDGENSGRDKGRRRGGW